LLNILTKELFIDILRNSSFLLLKKQKPSFEEAVKNCKGVELAISVVQKSTSLPLGPGT